MGSVVEPRSAEFFTHAAGDLARDLQLEGPKSTPSHEDRNQTLNVTMSDTFSLFPEISDDQIRVMVKKELRRGKEDPELHKALSPEEVSLFRQHLESAENFIGSVLFTRLPSEIQHLHLSIKNEASIVELLRRLVPKSRTTSPYAPLICAILKVAISYNEVDKKAFKSFKAEKEFLEDRLFADGRFQILDIADRVQVTDNKESIRFSYASRGKEMEGVVLKMTRKPEEDAEKVIRDGIGFEIEVEEKDLVKLVPVIITMLLRLEADPGSLELENKNMVSAASWPDVSSAISEGAKKANSTSLRNLKCTTQINPHSAKQYRAIHLTGRILIPDQGKTGNMKRSKPVEIKFVYKGNKNNEDHPLFKAKQKLSVITRLFGSIKNHQLENVIQEAALSMDISERDAREQILPFLEQIEFKQSPKAESIRGKRTGSSEPVRRWVDTEQFERLSQASLVPPVEVIQTIGKTRKRSSMVVRMKLPPHAKK